LAAKSKTNKAKSKGKAKQARGTKGVDLRLVKALAHELRVEILTILNERMASPNELAKELNEGLSQVSYHVKVLKDYECITLVKTEPRRGAVEHYYRATSRPFVSDRDWQQLPGSVRSSLSAELLELIQEDAIHALVEGTFDARADAHLTRNLALLDEKGWRDLMKGLGATQSLISKVQTESAVTDPPRSSTRRRCAPRAARSPAATAAWPSSRRCSCVSPRPPPASMRRG